MELCIYPPRPRETEQQQGAEEHPEANLLYGSQQAVEINLHLASWEPRQEAKSHHQGGRSPPLAWRCSDAAIMQTVKSRDPTGQGLPNLAAVRLLLHLLNWNPAQRPTAAEALQHAFFVSPLDAEARLACTSNRTQAGWC